MLFYFNLCDLYVICNVVYKLYDICYVLYSVFIVVLIMYFILNECCYL